MILDRSELEKYLEQNPWPLAFSQEKQVEYIYRFHTPLSREDAWKLLSDTSEINRRLGRPRVTFTERDGKIFGRCKPGWRTQEWEEIPWQWEYPSEIRMSREYTGGIAAYVRIHYFLKSAADGGTEVFMYFGWIPSGLAAGILLDFL